MKESQIKLPFKSIKMTMAVLFSVVIIVTLLIFSVISLNYTDETVLNNSIEYTTKLISQVNREIESYVGYMENISNVVINNRDVRRYLSKQAEQLESGEERERIQAQFDTVMETRKDISNIALVGKDGRCIINDGSESMNPNVDPWKVEWYARAMAGKDNVLTASHVQYLIQDHYEWVVTLSSGIMDHEEEKTEGVFFIDLNYGVLRNVCNSTIGSSDYYVFLLDDDGSIIYHPKQRLLYNSLQEEPIKDILQCRDSYFLTGTGANQKLYTVAVSEETGWRVVGVAKISELMGNRVQTQQLYWITAVVLLGMAVFLSSVLSGYITRPIKYLKNSMAEVEKGNFVHAAIKVLDESEIGSLGKSFNIMTVKIQQLMEQIIYEQEQKRINELKVLQAQINPHFLYNTLDSIIWMAEGNKNKEVVIMTSSLAKLLRQSINNENEEVALAKEISYVDSYLTIQKMRYRDKLEYHIEVEDSILQESVIKLILQPLVENAIYHGIKYKEAKGTITVRGYSRGTDMILEVEDDGAGMDEDTLRNIFQRKQEDSKGNGIGVQNVLNRIRLYYGSAYGISFESSPGRGTKATVLLPRTSGRRLENHYEMEKI